MIRRSSVFAPSRSRHRAAVLLVVTAAAAVGVASAAEARVPESSETPSAAAGAPLVASPGPRVAAGLHTVLRHAPVSWHASVRGASLQQKAVRETHRAAAAMLATLGANGAARVAIADATPIDWRILAGLDYQTGTATDTLKQLEGKEVRIPGFVVPLDDFMEDGAEFLLVPYYGACVHTPPPPPNQIIFVQMAGKKSVKLTLFDAVWMYGKLKIATVESPYGTVGFTLEGLKMEPYSSK